MALVRSGERRYLAATQERRRDSLSLAGGSPIEVNAKPLFKWPGGKRALAPRILSLLPSFKGRYFEPFLGGGAIFLALRPREAQLSDANPELINAYLQVRDRPSQVIRLLSQMPNSEDDYYRIRESAPKGPVALAARLIYLTQLSFNGIHRVNLRGKFNVPYGRKTHLDPCDAERIHRLSDALQGASIFASDFEAATIHAKRGDLVYFDPPYTVAHGNNGFLKYNEKIFSWGDQVRLARHAEHLVSKGVHVAISNADHQSTREIYSGLSMHRLSRFSRVAASSEARSEIHELLILG